MAVTRLWFFTLQPHTSPTDPAFTQLWTDVLELCARYSPSPGPSSSQAHVAHLSQPCPKRAHHFLFQSSSSSSPHPHSHPQAAAAAAAAADGITDGGDADGEGVQEDERPVFVLISTYPSLALCKQAASLYAQLYQAQVFQHVRHRSLRQLDMEDAEVVPALLSRAIRSKGEAATTTTTTTTSSSNGTGHSPLHHHHQNGSDAGSTRDGTVTVTISDRDPLRSEVAESKASPPGRKRSSVLPPDEEISGADTYEPPPPAPPPAGAPAGGGQGKAQDGDAGPEKDVFKAQRGEGRKWLRISRHADVRGADGDIEVFRLKELLAR